MSDSTQLADQFLLDSSLKNDVEIRVSKDKNMINVIDLNQGSYQSGIVTLDATNQLNGSKGFSSLKDAYVTIPYVVTLKNGAGALAAATNINNLMATMKCNVATIIDKVQIELNGKTIVTPSGYLSHWNNIRAMTEWSKEDVEKYGATNFMFTDDWYSTAYSNVASVSGDGFVNNANNAIAGIVNTSAGYTSAIWPENTGFIKRSLCNPSTVQSASGGVNTMGWPSLASAVSPNIAAQTGRGAFVAGQTTASATVGTWYYMLKIRLIDIHPIFKELDLVANPQLKLTLYINSGSSIVNVSASNTLSLASTTLTQGNTCPVQLASAASGSSLNGLLNSTATTLTLAFGVLQNSITPLATASQYFPYSTTRLYIPFYDLVDPTPIISRPIKSHKYLDYYVQSYKGQAGVGVSTGQLNAGFSLQLSASLKNVKYVALLPFSNTSSGHYATATNVDQYASPFDSAPWTMQAGSCVTNFNVQIGNQYAFNSAYSYDFNGFLDEFTKLGSVNGALTHEISNGLIDEDKWANCQRILVADVSRLTSPDVPTSILITGTNASSQGVDFVVLAIYEKKLEINRLTGEVNNF